MGQMKDISPQAQALKALQKAQKKGGHSVHLEMLATALKGKRVNFEKLIKLCDDMIRILGKETKDDDDKKAYCNREITRSDDELTEMKHALSDYKKEMED